MKRSYLFALTLIITVISIWLLSQGHMYRQGEREFFAMNTIMRISVTATRPDKTLDQCEKVVQRTESLTSAHVDSSEVSILSREGVLHPSKEVRALLRSALEIATASNGAFDPTIGALTDLWRIGTPNARVPQQWEIKRALELVDHRGLTETPDGAFRLRPHQRIDLGGIAKGFAGDLLADSLQSMGVRRAILDLGGNVVVLGDPEDGLWRIGVQHPNYPRGTLLGVLELSGPRAAVVTSGVYERFLEVDHVRYHHILDPKTGYPAQSGLLSVTVVSRSSTMADALSTALFVMGPKRAGPLLKKYGASAIFVTTNGKVLISPDLKGHFLLKDRSFVTEELKGP